MARQTNIIEVIEKRMEMHIKEQDFDAAAHVREIKRAMKDNHVLLAPKQVRAVNSFLDIIAHK